MWTDSRNDVILTKSNPRIVNLRTGEVKPLRKDGGMFILDVRIWVPTSRSKTESRSDVALQSYVLLSEDLVGPQVDGGGCKELTNHDEDILTLNVDEEALEEEMDCDLEDETVHDAERVRTISNPGQPSKKKREEHEATHARYRSWCIACVRGRGIAVKHHRTHW